MKTYFSYRIYECPSCKERFLQGNDSEYACIYCEYRRTEILKEGVIYLDDN